MAVTAGIDLMRGRPTPAIGSTEAKLQQRKLDALRRGVHRVADADALPYGIHLVGIGGAGVAVVEQWLRDAPADLLANPGSRLSALAIDIGDGASLAAVAALAAKFGSERAHVETLALALPSAHTLAETLQQYRGFLDLEYPMLQGSAACGDWLDPAASLPAAGESTPRAVAKAVYGQAYYAGARPMHQALKRFAASVNATRGDAVVGIVFGLGGGTGSGIAPDLARHLSTGLFGRRVLVTGIAIAPCAGDAPVHRGAALFPALNELDALCDEAQNRGVVQACGELYKNPFTAGFLLVPQQPAFARSGTLVEAHAAVDRELAALLTLRHGANLWEVLRLLNWVAAPSTQHSAARTPWGARWLHLFGFQPVAEAPGSVARLPQQLGLAPGYVPEFIEARVGGDGDAASAWVTALDRVFGPVSATQLATGGAEGSLQFVLPRLGKTDLALFFDARDAYDRLPATARRSAHALLLERGVVLCEPSTRLDGMAGASLPGGESWVAVALDAMRGPPHRPAAVVVEDAAEVRHAA